MTTVLVNTGPVFLSSFSRRCVHSTPVLYAVQRLASPNVIKVPARLRIHLERIKEKERQDVLLHAYRRKKGPLIVSCQDKKLNHYLNRRYPEFNASLHLASWGWKNNKSCGQRFSIVAHAAHPSFDFPDDAAEVFPTPKDFAATGLRPDFVAAVDKLGFRVPTLVQGRAIPRLLRGANVSCAAETGSGKTHAYLLPLLQNALAFQRNFSFDPRKNSPQILILVPSKELVHQVETFCRELCDVGGFEVSILGLHQTADSSLFSSLKQKRRIDVAIGTPQLVANLFIKKKLDSNGIMSVVLDESDTLLDDSFVNAVSQVLNRVKIRGVDASHRVRAESKWQQQLENDYSESRTDTESSVPVDAIIDHAQLVLVGAARPDVASLERVVETESLVYVNTPQLHRVSPHVHHDFYRVKPSLKNERFLELLDKNWTKKNKPPTMVFCNRNDTVYYLKKFLEVKGVADFMVLSKHVTPEERLEVLHQFHSGHCPLLLCSDLASRGLDTSRAVNVVNFEFPDNSVDYIHRAGRVGRLGNVDKGRHARVISLVSQRWEVELLWELERSVRMMRSLPDIDANIKQRLGKRHEVKAESSAKTEAPELGMDKVSAVGYEF